jgi:ubiquinone/menaquinone biosynthesis C-methylase UbiE
MKDFYTAFYTAVERSPAHRAFCERVFGLDLSQHGFTDLEQLELLLQVAEVKAGDRLLDLGCGNGRMAEYISDRTGAHVTGLDYIPQAIFSARQRTTAKADRLEFVVGDINHLELPAAAFDLILLMDTLYFSEDYTATLKTVKHALRPRGRLAIFYSHGREPWVPLNQFPAATLPPRRTPAAKALRASGLPYCTWDLTRRDYAQALRRKSVLSEMKAEFEAEGTLFIYENRLGDAVGIVQAIEEGLHARYLYYAVCP